MPQHFETLDKHPAVGRDAGNAHRAYDLNNCIVIKYKAARDIGLEYLDIFRTGKPNTQYGIAEEIAYAASHAGPARLRSFLS